MCNCYPLAWKISKNYCDESGPYSDETCDLWESWYRGWKESLAALPQSDFGWKGVFSMLEEVQGEKPLDADDIKRRINIFDLISQYGPLRKMNESRAMGKCPWHGDKSPSLSVDIVKGLWHCFAGCGGGDCFTWVMKAHELDFVSAVKLLSEYV